MRQLSIRGALIPLASNELFERAHIVTRNAAICVSQKRESAAVPTANHLNHEEAARACDGNKPRAGLLF